MPFSLRQQSNPDNRLQVQSQVRLDVSSKGHWRIDSASLYWSDSLIFACIYQSKEEIQEEQAKEDRVSHFDWKKHLTLLWITFNQSGQQYSVSIRASKSISEKARESTEQNYPLQCHSLLFKWSTLSFCCHRCFRSFYANGLRRGNCWSQTNRRFSCIWTTPVASAVLHWMLVGCTNVFSHKQYSFDGSARLYSHVVSQIQLPRHEKTLCVLPGWKLPTKCLLQRAMQRNGATTSFRRFWHCDWRTNVTIYSFNYCQKSHRYQNTQEI